MVIDCIERCIFNLLVNIEYKMINIGLFISNVFTFRLSLHHHDIAY